jgi:murein DD-endopeptidase MepM/ murein hydrolase activator NlpD
MRYRSAVCAGAAAVVLSMVALGGSATAGGGGVSADGTATEGTDEYAFPVRAKYSYGDGIGAGRGHRGQDILAGCGKKVVAVQAGRVRVVDYQADGAGNYAVVKGKGYDYVYMHMLRRPVVKKGERVQAGDVIGLVGSTGRSTACHLHFEMWTKPGWYKGGDVEDPKPFLRRWARPR